MKLALLLAAQVVAASAGETAMESWGRPASIAAAEGGQRGNGEPRVRPRLDAPPGPAAGLGLSRALHRSHQERRGAAPRSSTESGPGPDFPIFEGYAGRYATFTAAPNEDPRAGGALDTTRGSHWQGFATLRTPSWRGLRVFAQAETAPQSGALSARSLETWQGAEVVGGLSWDGFAAGPWTIAPAVAAGAVVALGEDRDRIDTTPSLLAAGARFGYRSSGGSVRLYLGVGRHEVTNGERSVLIADVLVRLPLLGDRVALHAKWISGEASSWRYGIVARWW